MATNFQYRLASIRPGVHYDAAHQPCDLLNGRIAYWIDQQGLSTFSAPAQATAVYAASSTGRHSDLVLSDANRDPVFKYYWPKPDDEYAAYVTEQ